MGQKSNLHAGGLQTEIELALLETTGKQKRKYGISV